MTEPIRVAVDPTNPGQFFACCGLLELADRLWPGAQGWFADGGHEFCMTCGGSLAALIEKIAHTTIVHLDESDPYSSPIQFDIPERPLRVDWWCYPESDAKDLKVWAGTMESYGIAYAMQFAMRADKYRQPNFLDIGEVVTNPGDPTKKKEPYYFDARRGPNAHSRDVGFSPNDLGLTTTAYPAVELLCLVGLQRSLPAKTSRLRVYDYCTWPEPIPPLLLPAVVPGELTFPGSRGYRFENWFRTGQKKHKAFRSAIPLSPQGAR